MVGFGFMIGGGDDVACRMSGFETETVGSALRMRRLAGRRADVDGKRRSSVSVGVKVS
jgi:hypothetical protein